MAQLPSLDWNEVAKAFEKAGWQYDRTKGSHYIMTRPHQPGLLSVPMHKPVKKGTLRKLIREAGLTVDEFVDFHK
jgi:predicted RNA binding protein YcfA (HicA-like mRNA interferase family)